MISILFLPLSFFLISHSPFPYIQAIIHLAYKGGWFYQLIRLVCPLDFMPCNKKKFTDLERCFSLFMLFEIHEPKLPHSQSVFGVGQLGLTKNRNLENSRQRYLDESKKNTQVRQSKTRFTCGYLASVAVH